MDKLKLAVIADLHYYSPSLGTTGRAYEIRSATDQKCLAESGALTDAAFESIALSDCDAVLIAGDLSNDGEVVSHQEVKSRSISWRSQSRCSSSMRPMTGVAARTRQGTRAIRSFMRACPP